MDQPEAACSKWKREADILFLPQVPKPRSDLAKLGLSFPKKRGKSFGLSSRLNSTDWTESRISTVADSLSDKKRRVQEILRRDLVRACSTRCCSSELAMWTECGSRGAVEPGSVPVVVVDDRTANRETVITAAAPPPSWDRHPHLENPSKILLKNMIHFMGGKDKKFQVYPQIPILWSNKRLLV